MKQRHFETEHARFWQAMTASLAHMEKARPGVPPIPPTQFPGACRRLAHHLALARQRGYSPERVEQLNSLVLRAHRQLYRQPPLLTDRLRGVLLEEFPRSVRKQWPWHLASALSLVLSAALLFLLVLNRPEMIFSVLDEQSLHGLESMYDNPAGLERDADDDLLMFGYYIYNNIGIAFRSFAGGLFLGVGALFIMIFNGGFLGAVTAHILNIEASEAFFTFVMAHGAPELVAVCLAGGAGLQLGAAILAPGRLSRLDALRATARRCLPVIAGVTLLLVAAAFIEAFWSPRHFDPTIKYAAGALCWLWITGWLLLGGRRAH